jgi:hypothetical protein
MTVEQQECGISKTEGKSLLLRHSRKRERRYKMPPMSSVGNSRLSRSLNAISEEFLFY